MMFLRFLSSLGFFSTLVVISRVIFLSYSRVKGPLVGETKIISGLLLTCSRTWVVGNVVCFSSGCTTDVDARAWFLVTTGDLGGGGFLVICLGMIDHGHPYSTIC